MAATIQYLQQEQVDKNCWDECINQAPNGLIYAYSFYLDHMAQHWDALVIGDYEAVMPLTWNKKYGIYYIYQPAFTASLGLFGKSIKEQWVNDCIEAIPSKFRLIDMDLNHDNVISNPAIQFVQRVNYVLDLQKPYEELYRNYNENVRRNARKAADLGCYLVNDVPLEKVLRLARAQMQGISPVKEADYNRFKKLYSFLHKKGRALSYGIYTANKELVSSCVFFLSHKRAYYILVGNHPNGKTMGASHYLIDRFIYDHAGKSMLLDFEGSDIRNLALFYSSFGAVAETYPALRINRLPWWARLAKGGR